MPSSRIRDAVKRIFSETFTARDIAEPLASFDAGASAAEVRAFMEARDFDVVGIRSAGRVVGFVRREVLTDGGCDRYLCNLQDATVLSDSAPLLEVLLELNRAPFLFITLLDIVGGIVATADLQKAPVRMWLFGIVTMIELRFTELIERYCSEDGWKKYLSQARMQKAEALLAERRRRRQAVSLFDCLQFSDKGQIIARNEEIRRHTVFASRRQAEDATKQLEQLRNSLAHAQDIVASDWDTVIALCEFIKQPAVEAQDQPAKLLVTRQL